MSDTAPAPGIPFADISRVDRRRRTWRVARIGVAGFVACAVGFVIWRMIEYRLPFPFWEGVDLDVFIERNFSGRFHWPALFGFGAAEHRIVFPLPIWILDYHWFASDGAAVIALNAALLLGSGILVGRWMYGDGTPAPRRIVLAALAPLGLFWPAQAENLNWSLQLNFILSVAALLAAIPLLVAAAHSASERRAYATRSIAAAAICVLVSSYSVSFGFVAWPIFIVYLLGQRAPRRLVLLGAIAGLATLIPFLLTLHPMPHHAKPLESLMQPATTLRYTFSLLGAPLHYLFDSPWLRVPDDLRIGGGFCVFALAIWAGIRVIFQRRPNGRGNSHAEACLALMALIMIANAFITALGRINFGLESSYISRYVLMAVPVWLGVAGYWVPRLPATRLWRVGGVGAGALLFVALTFSYAYQSTDLRARAAAVNVGAMAAALGISHPQMQPRIVASDRTVDDAIASLRRRGHRFFGSPWFAWYGRNAAAIFGAPIAGRCSGFVDGHRLVDATTHLLHGWAWDSMRNAPPDYLLALDADGIVRGIGFNGFRRPDLVTSIRRLDMYHAGWVAAVGTPNPRLDIVGVTRDGKLCRVATSAPRAP